MGEISLNFQMKLLRGLDGIGYTPIGGKSLQKSDFRLICATNRDLKELVRKGNMREDFFYRINVIPLKMPPLRERKDDIPLLIDHFLQTSNSRLSSIKQFPHALRLRMEMYSWPGNIRELKNVVERYITLGHLHIEDIIPISTAELAKEETLSQGMCLSDSMDSFEQKLIQSALEQCRWKKGDTASLLGLTMRTLQRKLKKHGIK
ncbi:MAG: sigma-54-dependent Fis family transcriptional regulator [Desulfobacter sp.]|nr:sigma-54-dependent Fis family transcriptional regulator [Desulfobacter sp.]